MEALILLATPIVVSALTEQLKKLKRIRLSTRKASWLRIFALTMSFIGVVASAVATGDSVPLAEIETYAGALVAFFATQVPYWFGKNK